MQATNAPVPTYVHCLMQTVFSALAKFIVRELRTTERSQVIVLYLGSVSTLAAVIACAVLPGGFVMPTTVPQCIYLIGAGRLTSRSGRARS